MRIQAKFGQNGLVDIVGDEFPSIIIQDIEDVPEQTRNEIDHFFKRYKDLEPGKFVQVDGWGNAAEAEQIVVDGFARLKAEGH